MCTRSEALDSGQPPAGAAALNRAAEVLLRGQRDSKGGKGWLPARCGCQTFPTGWLCSLLGASPAVTRRPSAGTGALAAASGGCWSRDGRVPPRVALPPASSAPPNTAVLSRGEAGSAEQTANKPSSNAAAAGHWWRGRGVPGWPPATASTGPAALIAGHERGRWWREGGCGVAPGFP